MPRNTAIARRRSHRLTLAAALAVGLSASACATTMPARSTAIDRIELVKSATFDHGCPAEDIRILGEGEGTSGSVFLLDVCGTRRQYTRIGSMYFDANRSGS